MTESTQRPQEEQMHPEQPQQGTNADGPLGKASGTAQSSDEALGTEKLGPLMLRMSIPTIVAQLINILYNMVDRIYVGRIPGSGSLALTGLGVCFPLIIVVSAFSAFVGNGGAPLASIALGRGQRQEAQRIMENGLVILLLLSVLLTAVLLIFKEPLIYLCGASADTFVYAEQYMSIYACGTIFVLLALGLNMFISAQGKATIAMLSVLIGAVLNIILDPIFIFTLNMGVRGAALATVISQAVSSLWVLGFLLSKHSILRLSRQWLHPNRKVMLHMAALGVSPFIMQATEGLISLIFNNSLRHYGGDLYVGAMTILSSVSQLINVPLMGFNNGVQPILSYNYGAAKYHRVRNVIKRMLLVVVTVSVIFCTAVTLFPRSFASLFAVDEQLLRLTAQIMPIFFLGRWIMGFQLVAQTAFIALGQAKVSIFIACFRKLVLLIPLALILPHFCGVMGIYYAEPIADSLSAITATILFALLCRRLLPKEEGAQNAPAVEL